MTDWQLFALAVLEEIRMPILIVVGLWFVVRLLYGPTRR